MDRFVSNTINNVDRKGRVSVPASFRAVLKSQGELHALMSVDHRVVEAGGRDMIEWYQQRLERLDPFSQEYEDWSFYINGDALELKLDGEG
ncbi:MAG: transcriptional regulator MraZ, partial [Nitratireductor sp.]|nr:transcriptional regulator MraZ [Nitratireductor sp.]